MLPTLVSMGKRAPGTETATPRGRPRIWVKRVVIGDGQHQNADRHRHYSIEDVPYVPFFDKGAALRATFWPKDLEQVQSHGCVNRSPDADDDLTLAS